MFPKCKVNEITTKNCTTSKNFDDLEISDVLENIKLLLDYIKIGNKGIFARGRKNNLVRARAGKGEKRILGASQDRSASARGGVAGFYSRKDL